MENSTHVGIGQAKIALNSTNLHTLGIGSCIVVYLFEMQEKYVGCTHIMLPTSKVVSKEVINKNKFADTAIPHLIKAMVLKTMSIGKLQCKFTGGASMFSGDTENIGEQNVRAVKTVLNELDIQVIGYDVGGNKGRSAFFNTFSKELKIVKSDEEVIII
ncbi:chemotaxis protein CheD [Candidatus Riflebacteria bacterium]